MTEFNKEIRDAIFEVLKKQIAEERKEKVDFCKIERRGEANKEQGSMRD